jgi:CheY-like chemotaxis protein
VLSFNRDEAFTAGCDDFLPKPFRETELLDKLATHLGLTWTGDEGPAAGARPAAAPPPGADMIAGLLTAARRGEVARLSELLARLRTTQPAFAAEAESLLRDYRMDQLRELLERQVHP